MLLCFSSGNNFRRIIIVIIRPIIIVIITYISNALKNVKIVRTIITKSRNVNSEMPVEFSNLYESNVSID